MISIVGFGRPKFGGASKATPTKSQKIAPKAKVCESCGQAIK